jgi:hypothetical protein
MSDKQFVGNIAAVLAFAIGVGLGGFCVDLVSHTTAIADFNMRSNYEASMVPPNGHGDICRTPAVPRRADFDDPEGKPLAAPDLRF